SPDNESPEISFAGIGRNIDPTGENQYKLGITDFETHDVSGLSVRRDYTLPLFELGALIFMVGVVQGMYWQHRRIWVHAKGEGILLAPHTNKNWFGIKKDIERMIAGTNLQMVVDQQTTKKNNEIKEDNDEQFINIEQYNVIYGLCILFICNDHVRSNSYR